MMIFECIFFIVREIHGTVNGLKFQTHSPFCSEIKCWLSVGLGQYIDTSICIDTDLADTVSIRLGAQSRYIQKFY